MKKVIIFTLIALTSIPFVSFSQSNLGKIAGAVAAGGGGTLEFSASTVLMNAKDSSVITRGMTDSTGSFIFEDVNNGTYILAVSAVNFKTAYIAIPEITQKRSTIYLKTIKLAPLAGMLQNVTVSAKKSLIQQKAGVTIINVSASPVNTGLTALELLEKSPGVSVNNDGKISLKGKQGVTILLDGKSSYMSQTDLTTLLKSMQSTSIETIEIMTNPPAKYDAAGNAGIINIKTKKGSMKGMNGNANLGYTQGVYPKFNGGVNLNYRNEKLNIFGDYNRSNGERFNELTLQRKFYSTDKNTLTGSADQVSTIFNKNEYNSIKAGVDYYFSKKDIAGIVLNGSVSDNTDSPVSNINVRDKDAYLLYRLSSYNDAIKKNRNMSANFNYKHTYDTTGRELNTDLDIATYKNTNNSLLTSQAYTPGNEFNGNPLQLKGVIPSDIDIYSAKVDYIHPFRKGLKLETGAKTSWIRTDNEVTYLRNNGDDWQHDNRSNHFIYEENINAAYMIASKSFKKWDFTAGLRLENTYSSGHQLSNDSVFKRNYTNLFPNVSFNYELNKKNSLNLSYSRRIRRPDYSDLNPFIFLLDSLTYEQGNPFLKPQFTNNIELSHTFNKIFTTTINYTRSSNMITDVIEQDTEKKLTYQTIDNLSSMQQLGASVSLNTPVNKWWNTNVFVNIYSNLFKGLYQDEPVRIAAISLQMNVSNSFTLGKDWTAEIGAWYVSKEADGLMRTDNIGSVNAGISKQVLNKKGTIKMSIRDIFYSQIFHGYARYSDVDLTIQGKRDTRQVSVSFNYRFGKKNIAAARKKAAGALDEQNRVKN